MTNFISREGRLIPTDKGDGRTKEEIEKENSVRRMKFLGIAKELLQRMRESYSTADESNFFSLKNEYKLNSDEVGLTEADKKAFNWTNENL